MSYRRNSFSARCGVGSYCRSCSTSSRLGADAGGRCTLSPVDADIAVALAVCSTAPVALSYVSTLIGTKRSSMRACN